MSEPVQVETPDPPEGRSKLALVIAFASAAVAVTTFLLGRFDDLRGSDVQLFPIDVVTVYRNVESDRIGVSLRPEFTNVAGQNYPDVLVNQRVEISVDGRIFACFGERGEAEFVVAENPEEGRTAHRRAPPHPDSPLCVDNTCYPMTDGSVLVLRDAPVRRALRSGEITSAELYFDARRITPTHSCNYLYSQTGRPTLAQFVGSAPQRVVSVAYHAQTLRDGAFTAHCGFTLDQTQLHKLQTSGWSAFSCATGSVTRDN